MAFTSIRLLGWGWGALFDFLLLASMLNLLRLLYKCAYTEPGIIPAIPTPVIDKSKTYSVEYIPESFRDVHDSHSEHFFDQKRFRVA